LSYEKPYTEVGTPFKTFYATRLILLFSCKTLVKFSKFLPRQQMQNCTQMSYVKCYTHTYIP